MLVATAWFATLGLPWLHTLVHALEDTEAAAPSAPTAWTLRIRNSAKERLAGYHRHDDGRVHRDDITGTEVAPAPAAAPALPARHQHGIPGNPGRSPADHGRDAPEHLRLAVQNTAAPSVLAAPTAVSAPPLLSLVDRLVAKPVVRAHLGRGPPRGAI